MCVAGRKLSWNKMFHISLQTRWFSSRILTVSPGKGWFLLKNKRGVPNFLFCLWKCNHDLHSCAYPTAHFNSNTCDNASERTHSPRNPPKSAWRAAPLSNIVVLLQPKPPVRSRFGGYQRRMRAPDDRQKSRQFCSGTGDQTPAGTVKSTSEHAPYSSLSVL